MAVQANMEKTLWTEPVEGEYCPQEFLEFRKPLFREGIWKTSLFLSFLL